MKKVDPYKSLKGALKALDNGGRFYNLFTRAADQVIVSNELYKAAGVVSDKTRAVLFFELALADLTEGEKRKVVAQLAPELKALRRAQRPRHYSAAAAFAKAGEGKGAIVQGYPRFVRNKSQFAGFIMVPIVSGNTTTFMMIPIIDQFDVYEVFQGGAGRGEKITVAATKSSRKLAERPTVFAGVAKRFSAKEDQKPKMPYLEAAYYS